FGPSTEPGPAIGGDRVGVVAQDGELRMILRRVRGDRFGGSRYCGVVIRCEWFAVGRRCAARPLGLTEGSSPPFRDRPCHLDLRSAQEFGEGLDRSRHGSGGANTCRSVWGCVDGVQPETAPP